MVNSELYLILSNAIFGFVASSTAAKLGFPAATTIYFAVDVDVQSGDIDGTIIPYFRGISQAMNNSIFKIGIYGTRDRRAHV